MEVHHDQGYCADILRDRSVRCFIPLNVRIGVLKLEMGRNHQSLHGYVDSDHVSWTYPKSERYVTSK
jgi:hypothetical protein